jgi:hypothetical protein
MKTGAADAARVGGRKNAGTENPNQQVKHFPLIKV